MWCRGLVSGELFCGQADGVGSADRWRELAREIRWEMLPLFGEGLTLSKVFRKSGLIHGVSP